MLHHLQQLNQQLAAQAPRQWLWHTRHRPTGCVRLSVQCKAATAKPAAAAAPGVKQPTQQQQRAASSTTTSKGPKHVDGPWLIVGLGNPGPRYDNTRHNIGFMVVDALAASAGIDMRKLEKSAAVGRDELHGQKVILAKPVTFMNNSGESVAQLAKFYKVPPQRVLVVSDDLDQPTAAVKLRQKGGHGGHNGLRSIIAHMGGSHDFPRLKIGIGRPSGELSVASYVLQEFRAAERAAVAEAIAEAVAILDSCLALGLDKALSGGRR